jgi:hypothetical protein
MLCSCCWPGKLPFASAPPDTDGLPDLHLALYDEVVVFDHATKLVFTVVWVHLDRHVSTEAAYLAGKRRLAALASRLVPTGPLPCLRAGAKVCALVPHSIPSMCCPMCFWCMCCICL